MAFACQQFQVSERRACKLLGMDRGSYIGTSPGRIGMGRLREALVSLARQKPRYGYRRLYASLMRRENPARVMRIYRLYWAEGWPCSGSSGSGIASGAEQPQVIPVY